jgi:Zn-dependent peptidase ImmA (M78 family)
MSSTSRGVDLEKRVFSLLEAEITANRFIARPECCAIFHQKAYYSRDRLSNIVFDVAIELTLPGADVPSMVWLIECKHYDHPVPVDDVEEFFTKVQQVAAAKSKAIVVTSNSFQSGALEFARSKGIGLLRVFPTSEFKWILHRSPSSLHMSRSLSRDGDVWSGLTEEHYHSRRFDFFCNVRDLFTYSLHDFFMALTSDAFDTTFLNAIAAERNDSDMVAFLSTEEIEDRCRTIRCAIGYKGGGVSLETVCAWQRLEAGLTVVTGAAANRGEAERGILGRISFNPPSIIVFFDPMDVRRQRFTLAHELGHLLLGHGAYMQSESVDEKDIESGDYTDLGVDDVRRLEWQANYFASCLLLPRDSFVASAFEKARQMDLKDRGYGLIFLDHQRINTRNYYIFTSTLMDAYEVSRTAVSIRLKALGLLNDSWTQNQ